MNPQNQNPGQNQGMPNQMGPAPMMGAAPGMAQNPQMMQGAMAQQGNMAQNNQNNNGVKVVQTDAGAKDGQTKCPACGSTDISTNAKKGMLRCNFCRHEFKPEAVEGFVTDISQLQGQVIGSGAQDIQANAEAAKQMITLKCESCGAEVVLDVNETTQARCHWCRNTLSINSQIPNGAIPDTVLPFAVTKQEAQAQIAQFVQKRQFFANPKFKEEFTTDNIMGVYFPYMLVDINAHASMAGHGEHKTRQYTRTDSNGHTTTYYDADVYYVEREFDIYVNGLSVESNSDRANSAAKDKTNNIINSIMPFDVENCVRWDSNYLKGYTSERRDTNIGNLKDKVDVQAKDIARFAANDSLGNYDRGVAWSNENLVSRGQQWKAAYLPVWLYSYQEVKGDTKRLHYVAVNARTRETMGSVPIHMPKLLLISAAIEAASVTGMVFLIQHYDWAWLLLTPGFIFFMIFYIKYRNADARHHHETETKRQIANLRQVDTYQKHIKGVTNPHIQGCNNTTVGGQSLGNAMLSMFNTGK